MPSIRRVVFLTFCFVYACSALASQDARRSQANSRALTNKDVVDMLSAGLTSEIVLAKIKSSDCEFDTSPDALKELKAASVPDGLILAMVQVPVASEESGTVEPKAESSEPLVQQSPASPDAVYGAQTCSKVISFALADSSGVHPFMGTGNWIENWIRKNNKKYSDVCFSQSPMGGRTNYLVVLSQSASFFSGFDPVVKTDTSTSTSPVSGTGTVTNNYGGMWNYTYNGTVTNTTTTTTHENVPYTINSNTLFANAYEDNGVLISRRYHVYSTKSGGDSANSLGYNLGNGLRAINARGRLIGLVVNDIDAKK